MEAYKKLNCAYNEAQKAISVINVVVSASDGESFQASHDDILMSIVTISDKVRNALNSIKYLIENPK